MSVLVDSSVWIDHFRVTSLPLVRLLADVQVVTHPFVVGELACGRLARRTEILGLMRKLPGIDPVSNDEALALVEHHGLAGSGIGWVDVHLLAAARVGRVSLWTRDRRLADVARRLGV